jgi:hypothetical protein
LWLFPLYVSAILVRDATWSAALGAGAAVWLLALASLLRTGKPGKPGWKALLAFAIPLAAHAVWLTL